ncbi:hypothetical protein [Chitinilyticum piscinae]|uniref:Solute-binding protein family 3/N-terminal domain-containing protein n=1 Tax=Chitinilyticum piscinae TaxID=2866724 RepID=A0A8J7FIU4_9NEIS|nr:hypothetical protein [Chitinilyticum piscinae]MBE9610143.1 hypothetical protein [Chitinilyticum piscinae]
MTLSRRNLLAMLLLAALSPFASAEDNTITILTQQDVLSDYQKFLKGRDPLGITQFGGEHSRRDVVELVLVQQALKAGGNTRPLRLVTVNNTSDSYNRYLKEVSSGNASLGGNSVWLIDLKPLADKVYISEPSIRQGEFTAGLYTTPGNKAALAAQDKAAVQKLTAVVADSWKPDIATLESIPIPNVLKTQSWESMVGMVSKQRADVILAPFQPTPDLSFEAAGQKFVPIPNIRVGLQGSRHFFVSRSFPNSAQIAKALNTGLDQLRANGTIEKAYRESGFFNEATAKWSKIN